MATSVGKVCRLLSAGRLFHLKRVCNPTATNGVLKCSATVNEKQFHSNRPIYGIILAKILNTISTSAMTIYHYTVTSICLSIIAVLVYMIVQSLGYDPLWSVVVASKWCAYKEWVHLDTTLFYSIVRDVSTLTGLGLGVWLNPQMEKKSSLLVRLLQIALALVVTMTTDKLKPAHDSVMVFYTIGFFKHLATTCFLVAGIPKIFSLI